MPDVFVIPAEAALRFRGLDSTIEANAEAVPFVAEVWSRSTGDYDVSGKLAEYRARGDVEIWLIHPYERRVTAHRRSASGAYEIEELSEVVRLVALANVTVDLRALFSRF